MLTLIAAPLWAQTESAKCRDKSEVGEALRQFLSPGREARTKVWWFQGETETTSHGITADVEAFARVGIGGVVLYDQVHGKPTSEHKPLKALSPEWWQMLKLSATEAQRVGLTVEAALSNGYVGGGPWITPDMAMQRLEVVSKVVKAGDKDCSLPPLPKGYARDVAVVTIPFIPMPEPKTVEDNDSCVVMDFGMAVSPRTIEYRLAGQGKAFVSSMNRPLRADESDTYDGSFCGYMHKPMPSPGVLEGSADAVHYDKVVALHPRYNGGTWGQVSVAIPKTATAYRYYRIRFDESWRGRYRPTDIQLLPYAKTDLWEERVGLRSNYIDDQKVTPKPLIPLKREQKSPLQGVKGLTLLLRFYSTVTGGKTKHGRPELMGYECDKMSRRAAELQYNNYFKCIVDTLRAAGVTVEGLAVDSHEAGSQNWTADFPSHFRRLRGYDIMPWLPAMAGYKLEELGIKPLEGPATTEEFQADVRRTIAELVATEYIGALDSLCRRDGLLCTAQAVGNGQSLVSDNIWAKCMVQKPQGEFWAYQRDGAYDIKEAASSARLMDKPIASAEAFTDFDFSHPLGYLKPIADHAYAMGLQEFVVCAVAYQPWGADTIPGSTAGGRNYGLTRTNTQWEMSRPFWDYQARCASLLRMGKSVADVLVLLGGDAPVKLLTHRLPRLPQGVDFDVATDEAFLATNHAYPYIAIARDARLSGRTRAKLDSLKAMGVRVFAFGEDVEISEPDIHCDKRLPFARFTHRRLDDADIYFIYNPTREDWSGVPTFRSSYRHRQLWTPIDARCYSLADTLTLRAGESAFVVLSDKNDELLPLWTTQRDTITTIGQWNATFRQTRGGSQAAILPATADWTRHDNEVIRHFSGTAIYETTLDIGTADYERIRSAARAFLSCQNIGALASVTVNGRYAGTLWGSPMEVDITSLLKEGSNTVTLSVCNVNANRMIGDASLPEDQRATFSWPPTATPTDPLVPSGLLSPVRITVAK